MAETLKNPYCSLLDVQNELRNTSSSLDDEITRAINAASRYIDEYKGRDYFYHDHRQGPIKINRHDELIYGDKLFLPYRPIIELIEVKVAGTVWEEDTNFVRKDMGVLIALGGSTIQSLQGLGTIWPAGDPPDGLIEIKGRFGYAQEAGEDAVPTLIPEEIRQAAILIAAAFSGHNQKDVIGLDGSKEQVVDKVIPKTALNILGTRNRLIL